MQALTPYVCFNGNCREAMNFYKEVFEGKLELMTWADGPHKDVSTGDPNKIMHGMLTNGSFNLMASDNPEGKAKFGDNVQLTINCESVPHIEKLFKALGTGGKTVMPLDNTFWGARFGMLTDKFGIYWMLNCPLEKK